MCGERLKRAKDKYENSFLCADKREIIFTAFGVKIRGDDLDGIFWVGMCRPGLQIDIPFWKKFPLKLIPRSRNGPIFYTPF